MKIIKCICVLLFCMVLNTVFGQGKTDGSTISKINVYFPGSEVDKGAHKLNLNVQGRILAVPLCEVTISNVDEHNFQFTAKSGQKSIMRGTEPTSFAKLTLVHSSSDKFVVLLQELQKEICNK